MHACMHGCSTVCKKTKGNEASACHSEQQACENGGPIQMRGWDCVAFEILMHIAHVATISRVCDIRMPI